MNFGVTILLVISGWALLSIMVSLGFGGIAKARGGGTGPGFRFPTSDDLEDRETYRATPHTVARRTT